MLGPFEESTDLKAISGIGPSCGSGCGNSTLGSGRGNSTLGGIDCLGRMSGIRIGGTTGFVGIFIVGTTGIGGGGPGRVL